MTDEKELGTQPLDGILEKLQLKNSDVVAKSTKQLTHKAVAKARKGRVITMRMRLKILEALNRCLPEDSKPFKLKDLFTY